MKSNMFLVILLFTIQFVFAQEIVINEVMSSNNSTIFDEEGDTPDWIELYNVSLDTIDLGGYYLSDDSSNNKKWRFGNAVIDPQDYLIVFASDKDTNRVYWHTNFKISSSGEKLMLSDSSGAIIDTVIVPVLRSDISYARENDGTLPWSFQEPTPDLSNNGSGLSGYADAVVSSMSEHFYPSSISVELSAGDSQIFYTLDGSDPDESSTEYSVAIEITSTTVLKAISYKDGYLPGFMLYHTYFINENTDLPVISLISDPDGLFGLSEGIYTNYEEDWEREARVSFFEDDKQLGFSENVVINMYGGYSRSLAQKSFAVKFKSDQGINELNYPLFPDFDVTTFKSFILRNSGNDFEQTHIRDAFMQTLVEDRDIDYLEYRPAVTYINGEYWGIYNIREKISEHYVANRHGIDPDKIDMMEGYSAYNDDQADPDGEYGLWVGNLEAIHGDTINYKQLIDYLNTEDLTTEAAYSFIDSMINIDECLLYYAAQVYYNSQDWPSNNSKYWRERSPQGKWRWILYDLDFGFNLYEWGNEGNSEDHVDYLFSGDPSQRPWSKPVESTFIPRKIVENPHIKNQFVNQVADLLNSNFKTARVLNIMNEIADHIAGDLNQHRTRFNINGNNLDRLISFAQNRPGYLRDHVRNFFASGEDISLTLNISGEGNVKLNSLIFEQADLPWNGLYFRDNEIHLQAMPANGYKFDGWSGTIESEDIFLHITDIRTINLNASFSVDTVVAKDIVINEINYNSADDFDSGDWIELYNRSNQSINVSGWYFSDSDVSHKFFFPAETVIEPENYLVIVQNDSAFSSRFTDVINYVGETGFGLNGSGEFIKLVNNTAQIIDSLTYDDNLPWPVEADGLGATLELTDPSSDNANGENWRASHGHGSPGEENVFIATRVIIEKNNSPSEYSLSQNYPNPFNPTTTIEYSVPKSSYLTLKVYNLLGQEVKSLFEGVRQAGKYKALLNAEQLSSGIYLYQLKADHFIETKKLILFK